MEFNTQTLTRLLDLRSLLPDGAVARDIAEIIASLIGLMAFDRSRALALQISSLLELLNGLEISTRRLHSRLRDTDGAPGYIRELLDGVLRVNGYALSTYQAVSKIASTRLGEQAIVALRTRAESLFESIQELVQGAPEIAEEPLDLAEVLDPYLAELHEANVAEFGAIDTLPEIAPEALALGFEETTYAPVLVADTAGLSVSTLGGFLTATIVVPDLLGRIAIVMARANRNPDIQSYTAEQQEQALSIYTQNQSFLHGAVPGDEEDPSNDQQYWLGRSIYFRNQAIAEARQHLSSINSFWSHFKQYALRSSQIYQDIPYSDDLNMNSWRQGDIGIQNWTRAYLVNRLADEGFDNPSDSQLDTYFAEHRPEVYEEATNQLKQSLLNERQIELHDFLKQHIDFVNSYIKRQNEIQFDNLRPRQLDPRSDRKNFDLNIAYLACRISQACYGLQTTLADFLDEYEFFHSIRGMSLICYDRGLKRIIVGFRGTADFWDMMTDADFRQATHVFSGAHPIATSVHQGFSHYYDSCHQELFEVFNSLMDNEIVEEVLVCGHSLGGALATLFTFEAFNTRMFRHREIPLLCYTYGSPRVGNDLFQRLYDRDIPNHFACKNRHDIVPQMPPSAFHYRHVGRAVMMDPRTFNVLDNGEPVAEAPTSYGVNSHFLKTYEGRLDAYGGRIVKERPLPDFRDQLDKIQPEYQAPNLEISRVDIPAHSKTVFVRDVVISRASEHSQIRGMSVGPSIETS